MFWGCEGMGSVKAHPDGEGGEYQVAASDTSVTLTASALGDAATMPADMEWWAAGGARGGRECSVSALARSRPRHAAHGACAGRGGHPADKPPASLPRPHVARRTVTCPSVGVTLTRTTTGMATTPDAANNAVAASDAWTLTAGAGGQLPLTQTVSMCARLLLRAAAASFGACVGCMCILCACCSAQQPR